MIQSFLMIGQSNMAGRGFLTQVQPIYNERIQMLRNGRWQMMTEPINYDRPVAGVGLAASFAAAWCQSNEEDQVGLIPWAEGGSTLHEWGPEGILFRHAVSQARFALESSQLAGILWHQGESDSYGGTYRTYFHDLQEIIIALREELNAPDVPLIVGGLGDFLGKTGFGKGCTEHQQINDALQRFALEQPNCYFATAQGLSGNPDGIHFDAISQRKLGLRYFEAYSTKQHVLQPLSGEEEAVNLEAGRAHTTNEQIYLQSMDFALGKISYEAFERAIAAITKGV